MFLIFILLIQRGDNAGKSNTAGGANGKMDLNDFANVLPVIVKF